MDVETYIHTFNIETRDAVVNELLTSRVVRDALDTPAGKALLGSVIDSIRDKIRALVGVCAEQSTKAKQDKMQHTATEIHIMYHLLRNWAQILVTGDKHEEAMRKSGT